MKNWIAGMITVSAIIIFVTLHSLFTHNTTLYQLIIIAFSYYGMITMAFCLIFKQKKSIKNQFYRPFVSILIPAKNEEKVIEATIRSLSELNYRKNNKQNYEIIVIDDGSSDNTSLVLQKLSEEIPFLRPLQRQPGEGPQGKSAVLNFGLSHAKGDVIAVFDADTHVEPDFLRKTVPLLYDPKVGGVQGRVRICNANDNVLTQLQEDEFATFAHMVQISKETFGGVMILAGNGQLTKRTALEEAGGWNELSATDDMDLTIKLLLKGKTVKYAHDAMIWQEGITNPKPLIRQRIRWAEGMLKCLYDYLFPLILSKNASLAQKIDSLVGLARITVPMGIWIGYLHIFTTYLFGWSYSSSLPQYLLDSLPWIFGIVMSGGLLKYSSKANLYALIRVPIYWTYNFFWMIAVPAGFYNCLRNVHCIRWDKTEHCGVSTTSAVYAQETKKAVGNHTPHQASYEHV